MNMRASRTPGTPDLFEELIVDSFAGGGGASMGIEQAMGRPVDVAINHSADAIAMHAANHPHTHHHQDDIWRVDPREATGGRPVGLAWFSPDCTHHSRAKGGKPVSQKLRGLAWVVVRWAATVRPRVIMLENVPEFREWGPLGPDARPDQARRGQHFARWLAQLDRHGYRVEHRMLCAADYGVPTTRTRLFLIARRDGFPIVWPEPTHGPGRLPYRTAAEIIDWSLPCPSIFLAANEARAVGCRRPLAEATLRRIARGIERYVIGHTDPFVAPGSSRTQDTRGPLPTIVPSAYGARLVAAFLAQHNGGMVGHDAREPVSTITGKACHQQVVASSLAAPGTVSELRTGQVHAFLTKYYGTGVGSGCSDPLHTITGRNRFGLVEVAGAPHEIADIGMRMLSVPELYRAQGFPDHYVTDAGADGRWLTKGAQLRLVGNSVCPGLSAALVRANLKRQVPRGVAA